MPINRQTTLFFDASVLVAAAYSPTGGSALLLAACRAGGFRAQITYAILWESIKALSEASQEVTQRLLYWLGEIVWEFLPVPSAETLVQYQQYVAPDDAHVLAAAVEGGSEYLLTLDRRHILAAIQVIKQAGLTISIMRPGDFIQQLYPMHEDYLSLPPPQSIDPQNPGG